jgi:N-acetylglutamate synthase-like GNAT family acetyltransferase
MESVLAAAYQEPASSFPRVRLATPNMHWIVADQAGIVVGCVYAICYGEIAYIGLMAVLPHAQRQGIGTALLHHLLATLEAANVRTVLLDASPAGAELYERLGFCETDTLLVYANVHPESPKRTPSAQAALRLGVARAELARVDRHVWQCDRGEILDFFLREAGSNAAVSLDPSGNVDGCILVRGRVIGPWLAQTSRSAEVLLDWALTPVHVPARVYVPMKNTASAALLESRGFRLEKQLVHMQSGAPSPVRRELLFGQGTAGTG